MVDRAESIGAAGGLHAEREEYDDAPAKIALGWQEKALGWQLYCHPNFATFVAYS
jgi:hypothetical protein